MWPSQSISSNTRVFSLQQWEAIWDLGGNSIIKQALWYSLLMQPSRTRMLAGWFSQASMGTIPHLGYWTISNLWPQPLELRSSIQSLWCETCRASYACNNLLNPNITSRSPSRSQRRPSPSLKSIGRVMVLNATLSGILNGKAAHIYYVVIEPKVKYQQFYSIKHFTWLFSPGEEEETTIHNS
jgi:hypothetical protein